MELFKTENTARLGAKSVSYTRATLPVLRTAEVAIVGGSFAGVAAALALARAGRSVVLIEQRTYLGREITATSKYWIQLDSGSAFADLPELVRLCAAASVRDLAEASTLDCTAPEIPLRPDAVKLTLEDLLVASGVDILFASLPVQVLDRDGTVAGLVIGNKSGRQVVECRTIIDATETGVVARLVGAPFCAPPAKGHLMRYTRVLEFDNVDPSAISKMELPADLGLAENTIRLHRGYLGKNHILVECQFDLPADSDPIGASRRETEARHRSVRLASHLIKQEAAFENAFLASSSFELAGPQTGPIEGTSPAWADEIRLEPAGQVVWAEGEAALPLGDMAGPVRNLWIAGEAARLGPIRSQMLRDAVAASRIGEALGTGIALNWTKLVDVAPLPEAVSDAAPIPDELAEVIVLEPESPQKGRDYRIVAVPTSPIPNLSDVDVVVVGGGTSGAPAAFVAARDGMRTVLLEMSPELGGTGTLGGIDSYWAGRRVAFCAEIIKHVGEIQDRLKYKEWGAGGNFNRRWSAEPKMYALRREAERAGVEMLFGAITIGTLVDPDKNSVAGVVVATSYGPGTVFGEVTIDASGDGDVAAFAGADNVYGSERENDTLFHSLSPFDKPGRTLNVKTDHVDVGNIEDYTRAILAGHRRGGLRQDVADIHDHAVYLAPRESRHILGEVVLTLTDQILHRCWSDVVNIHFSNHDIKGKSAADWVKVGLIPPNLNTEIPYRALVPRNLDGILIAGKAYSTTHDGLAGPRMMADLENQGGVIGLAASQAVREGVPPRQIDVTVLQHRLVEEGVLPEDILTRRIEPRRLNDADLEALVADLEEESKRPLYAYAEMKLTDRYDGPITFAEVCSAGRRIVPYLERALDNAAGAYRLRLAQALAMYDSAAAAPVLAAEIERLLGDGVLPTRRSEIKYVGPAPDQMGMPDVCFLLYSLGQTRQPLSLPIWERIVDLLEPAKEDFPDREKGTFYYVDAVCYGAERLGDPLATPILGKLHSHAALRDQVTREGFQVDYFGERQASLELTIGRALARCGSVRGYEILIDYLDDNRALLAEGAHGELLALTGRDYGKDRAVWIHWLSTAKESLRPLPYQGRTDMPGDNEELLRLVVNR